MAIKINELPVDLNLTGTEKIPAQEENGTGVSITTQAISTYVERNIVQSPVSTTVANTFARQYPVKGSIAKGQGVHIFTDEDNTVKMKASDNSSLVITRGADDSFSTNVDDFRQDLNVNVDVKMYPVLQDVSELILNADTGPYTAQYIDQNLQPVNNFTGVFITFVANTDGTGYEWHPDEGIGIGNTYAMTETRRWGFDLYRATIDASGDIKLYTRNWVRGSYDAVRYQAIANADLSIRRGSETNRINPATGANHIFNFSYPYPTTEADFIAGGLKLAFELQPRYPNPLPDYYYYITGLKTPVVHRHRNVSTAREVDGVLGVTLVQHPTNLNTYRWGPNVPAGEGAAMRLGSIGWGRLIQFATLSSIGLDKDTNILRLNFSNVDTDIGRIYYELTTGGERLVLSTSTQVFSSGISVTLTSTQTTSIVNNSYQIGFRFAKVSNLNDPLFKFSEVVDVTNITDTHALSLPIKRYLSTDTTLADATLSNSSYAQSFKITDTKVLISTQISQTSMFSVLIPKVETVNSVETATVDKTDTVLQTKGGSRAGTGSQQVFMLFEKVNNAWVRQKVFFPCFSEIHTTDKDVRNWSQNFQNVDICKEDDNEVIIFLGGNRGYSTGHSTSIEFQGFPAERGSINGVDESSDPNYVQFIKVSKTDNSIEYVLNEQDNSISNFFSNYRSADISSYSWWAFAEVGVENNNLFKMVSGRHNKLYLSQITKGSIGNYTKYSISILRNLLYTRYQRNTGGYQHKTSFYYFDPLTFTLYFTNSTYVYYSYSSGTSYNLNKVILNSDLTDFRRTYNSTTRLFDSATPDVQTAGFTSRAITNDIFKVLTDVGFSNTDFVEGPSLSSNAFKGTPYHFYNTGTFFTVNQKADQKTYFTFDSGTRTYLSQRAPFNCALFYSSTDTVELRRIDANAINNSFSFSFSPATAIGIATAAYGDGDTGTLAYLAGSSLITISGGSFVTGADYFMDNATGLLNSREGRPLGRAISQTEILING